VAEGLGGFGDLGIDLGVEDDLGEAFTVTKVDEGDAAVVFGRCGIR